MRDNKMMITSQSDERFVRRTKRRFESADKDQNGQLTKEEFALFLFPELSKDMTHELYREEMAERDM